MALALLAAASSPRRFSIAGMPRISMSRAQRGREAKSSKLRGVKRNGIEK